MWRQSVWSSCITAAIASKHLKEGGIVTLPGAKAATSGTPGMQSKSKNLVHNT